MAQIEGFGVKNYRALRDVTLGRLWNQSDRAPLTPLTAVIGKNGVGKSTVFDAFGFLADCLRFGVEEAAIAAAGAVSNASGRRALMKRCNSKSIIAKILNLDQSPMK